MIVYKRYGKQRQSKVVRSPPDRRSYHIAVCARSDDPWPPPAALVPHLRLQFHKLLRYFVRRPLAEDPQYRPSGLIHVDSPTEGQPAGTGALDGEVTPGPPPLVYLVHDVFELHDGNPYELVIAAKAIILHTDVQLVGSHLLLVTNDAVKKCLTYSLHVVHMVLTNGMFR